MGGLAARPGFALPCPAAKLLTTQVRYCRPDPGGISILRQLSRSIAWTLVVAATALPASGQVKAKADAKDAFVDLAGNLLVELPVSINGPPSEQVHEISTGDLVLLQIRYPIVPPMPASVAMTSKDKHV